MCIFLPGCKWTWGETVIVVYPYPEGIMDDDDDDLWGLEKVLEDAKEEIESWSYEKALSEAESDIKSGKVKVYYHGTYFTYAPGVGPEDYKLIEHYPHGDAGIGCVVDNWELRTVKGDYAETYNKKIIEWIKNENRDKVKFSPEQ
jgi:hypothetical protein